MLPSIRVIVRLAKNNPNSQSRMHEPTSVSKSKLVIPLRWRGVMLALHPNTKKILKRLLPITFPIAISGFFFSAATIEVASSGREVPPATSVRPMIDSLTPRLRAIPVAPLTNNCPPPGEQFYLVLFFRYGMFFLSPCGGLGSDSKCISHKDSEETKQ